MRMAKSTTGDGSAIDKRAKSGKPGKAASTGSTGFFGRIGTYFRDVRAEMTRVVWPTRTEILNSSVVVIVTLVFFAVFILIVDYLFALPVIKFIANIKIGG
jgi:preprotein translocase subunit SecE